MLCAWGTTRMPTQAAARNDIQLLIARLVATSPAGHNLLLAGGFRYRLLDQSTRASDDIDYHWSGDLVAKQQELLVLFRKRLLPAVRRQFGFEGQADVARGPDADSPAVKTVLLAFWKPTVGSSRIEIPVEVTRVTCADPMTLRTVDGVVYTTLSDADQIESKIISILSRPFLQHRDLVDCFLFASHLRPDSSARLGQKLKTLKIPRADIKKRIADLEHAHGYHGKSIARVIEAQLDPEAARNITDAGGARRVLEAVVGILRSQVGPSRPRKT